MGSLPQFFSSLVSFVLFDTHLILRLIELNNLLLATPPNSLPLPERVQSLVVQDALPEKERVGLGSIGSCFLVGRTRRIHRGDSGRKGGEDFQLDRCGGHREGREGGRGGESWESEGGKKEAKEARCERLGFRSWPSVTVERSVFRTGAYREGAESREQQSIPTHHPNPRSVKSTAFSDASNQLQLLSFSTPSSCSLLHVLLPFFLPRSCFSRLDLSPFCFPSSPSSLSSLDGTD